MVEVKLSKRAEQVLTSLRAERPVHRSLGEGGSNPEHMDCHGTGVPCNDGFPIRQVEFARQLGCSRWTIGRAIKKLKEAGLLVETGRDKQSRCKTYALQPPSPPGGEGLGVRFSELDPGSVAGVTRPGARFPLEKVWIAESPRASRNDERPTQWGQTLWERYERTYKIIFTQPDLKERFAQVSWNYKEIDDEGKLYSLMFTGLAESYGMPWG